MSGPLRLRALRLLEAARLLRPAYRAWEAVEAARTRRRGGAEEADGLPLPPPALRMLVAGTAEPEWFLRTGRASAAMVEEAAARHGVPLEPGTRLLDFGCGCGRVTRHWAGREGLEVHGSDFNARLVRWCGGHLPFGRFGRNGLEPPLPHGDGLFDVVYAISVLTHLTAEGGERWVAELRRVLRPGGLLLLTTHGESYLDALTPAERERFAAGEPVVRWQTVAGTNLCATYHPPAYVERVLAGGLELLEHVAEGAAAGSPHQDLVVLRRRGDARGG